jgi:hypothetical protein
VSFHPADNLDGGGNAKVSGSRRSFSYVLEMPNSTAAASGNVERKLDTHEEDSQGRFNPDDLGLAITQVAAEGSSGSWPAASSRKG